MVATARSTAPLAAVATLVIFNAIPLLGVAYLGWDLLTILVLYWIENGIIGIVNVAKISRAEGAEPPARARSPARGVQTARGTSRNALVAFFFLHYGIFWIVHGVFVLTIPLVAGLGGTPGPGGPSGDALDLSRFSPQGVLFAAVGLAVSHVAAYRYDYIGRGVYRTRSPSSQMFEPYPRLIVLHGTILVGAWIVFQVGQPILLIAFMVVLKTVIDVGLYLFTRRRQPTVPTGE
jgi:hypothetical protein